MGRLVVVPTYWRCQGQVGFLGMEPGAPRRLEAGFQKTFVTQ